MVRPVRLPCLALAALSLAAPAAADDSIDCTGGIVRVGDAKIDLLGKCGPPSLQEVLDRDRASLQRFGATGPGPRVSTTVERWTYNFGPTRFLQFVTMEAGRIVSITRGSYGYSLDAPPKAPPIPRARCDASALKTGLSTFDVLTLCGEPAFQDVRLEVWGANEVVVEVWTYDFGPTAFVRFLKFVDGRLGRIETGSYGYSR
ncbi:MAG TPA: DUF2845 domain-containing protein [Anaeromyxobacteraceae bacterium]|nr:DUF2845 domain-containing protein [Anaeromyxobacteraceae bacterium]